MPEKLYIKGRLPDPGKTLCRSCGGKNVQSLRKNPGVSVCKDAGRSRSADHKRNGNRNRLGRTQRSACRRDATWAVLGSGPDVCYPATNRNLYERILREKGGIISEYPPGTQPRNYHFPARNQNFKCAVRSCSCSVAKEKSGSLITAQWAAGTGKGGFALPGPVNEELSRGCHRLIYDGAGLAYKPEVLLEELGINCKNTVKSSEKKNLGLASDLIWCIVVSIYDQNPGTVLCRKQGFLLKNREYSCRIKYRDSDQRNSRHYYVKIQT